jgi:hypothetical protein
MKQYLQASGTIMLLNSLLELCCVTACHVSHCLNGFLVLDVLAAGATSSVLLLHQLVMAYTAHRKKQALRNEADTNAMV